MIQSCPLMPAFLRTWVIFFWAAANRLFVLSISASSSLSIWFCVPSSSPICRPICPSLTTCSPRWSKSSSCCLRYIIHTHTILTQMNIDNIFLRYLSQKWFLEAIFLLSWCANCNSLKLITFATLFICYCCLNIPEYSISDMPCTEIQH